MNIFKKRKKQKIEKGGRRKHAKIDCLPYYGNFFFLTKKGGKNSEKNKTKQKQECR
jgi:hypothetical protein